MQKTKYEIRSTNYSITYLEYCEVTYVYDEDKNISSILIKIMCSHIKYANDDFSIFMTS